MGRLTETAVVLFCARWWLGEALVVHECRDVQRFWIVWTASSSQAPKFFGLQFTFIDSPKKTFSVIFLLNTDTFTYFYILVLRCFFLIQNCW